VTSRSRRRNASSFCQRSSRFLPKIIPAYLRRNQSVEEFIPWLYLKGISTNDFSEALAALLGKEVAGLSPNVIVRLKETWCSEFEEWNRRDLSDRRYVYVWADGIHVNVRLEDEENRRQCLLVLMGATADGHKELIAVADGYRESEQGWTELLVSLRSRGLQMPPKLAIGDATRPTLNREQNRVDAPSTSRSPSERRALAALRPEQCGNIPRRRPSTTVRQS